MKCPIDNTLLVMADRNGIEIDYCPQCRGIWLDRGELDKIIERSETASQQMPPAQAQNNSYREPEYRDYNRDKNREYDKYRGYDNNRGQYPPKKKKENWLGELFDF